MNDREAQARALWCLMLVEFHTGGDSQQVLAYGEKALVMARELGLKELEGYVLGNLPMAADAFSIKMGIQRLAGEHEGLLATGSQAARLSQTIGNALHHYNALLLMGEIHCMQGRLGQALIHFEKAAAIIEESGDDQLLWAYHFYRAPVYLIGGALEQAFKTPDREVPFSFATVPLMVADGHLQFALGNSESALDRTEDVIHQLNQAGSRFYLAELLWLQGKAWLALENARQATQALMQAKKEAFDEAMSDRPEIAQGVIRALTRRLRAEGHLVTGK